MPTIPIPAVTLNMDMRNLKWGWPGYLTFGKNSKDKDKLKNAKAAVDERKPDSDAASKPDTGGEGETPSDAPAAEGDIPGPDPPKEGEKVAVEVEVDTVSLADAMESEGGHGESSNNHSSGVGTPGEILLPLVTSTVGPTTDDIPTPIAVQPADSIPASREGTDEISQHPTSPTSSSPIPEEELPPVIVEPPLAPVTFSQTLVHLAPPGHPLQTTKRRLYYLTVRRRSRLFPLRDLSRKYV